MPKGIADYKSPPHKIIAFLKEGRDQLRKKYRLLRKNLRVAENQVREHQWGHSTLTRGTMTLLKF